VFSSAPPMQVLAVVRSTGTENKKAVKTNPDWNPNPIKG